MTESDRVIVVGAGPVGMTTALALRAKGVPVTILEAEGEDRTRPGSRAIFIHRESLEHLESVSEGLGWEIARHGIVWTTKKTYYGENLVYERTYPPPDPTRLPHSTNLSQVVIEQLLLDACKRAGVDIVWEQELASSTTSPDGVVLRTAAATNGARPTSSGPTARGRSCDRPPASSSKDLASKTRSSSSTSPRTRASPMLPERVFYYEHPAVHGRNVLLVPFAGGIRADLQLRPDDDPEQFNDPEGVKRWIAQVLPPKYADRVAWVSTYRFYQVVASAFTDEHRRIALVGEAAHLFAPFGARGLNSGIPDALVAARAIAEGTPAAIDHFASTRREAALYNREASNLALQHMQANGWRIRLERRIKAAIARRGIAAGTWLDSSPFGPRAADHKTETGSY